MKKSLILSIAILFPLFLQAEIKDTDTGSVEESNSRAGTRCANTLVLKAGPPHSARHAMGKHIMEKTGNVAAIQQQLGHKNPAYSMQYARISSDELKSVLDDR